MICHYEEAFEGAEAAGYTTPGWYFWDETEAHCLGPWATQQDAERQMVVYAEWLNRPKDEPVTALVDDLPLTTTTEELLQKVEHGPGAKPPGRVMVGYRAKIFVNGVEMPHFQNITYENSLDVPATIGQTDRMPNIIEEAGAGSFDWIETPESSNIKRFKYDSDAQRLYVDFKNGNEYVYFGVPFLVANELQLAQSEGLSVGKIFSKKVQRAGFEYKNLSLEDGSDL